MTAATTRGTLDQAAAGDLTAAFARLDACGADPELIALAKRCLAPKREDRPADAGEVARAVTEYRTAAEQRWQASERDRWIAERRKRRRVQLALAASVLLLTIVSGLLAWWVDRAKQQQQEHQRLQQEFERLKR